MLDVAGVAGPTGPATFSTPAVMIAAAAAMQATMMATRPRPPRRRPGPAGGMVMRSSFRGKSAG